MVFHSPGQVAFYIFNFPVFWYGIVMACAVFAGVVTADNLAKKTIIPPNFIIDNAPFLIITGIIGARLYYCILNIAYYIKNPLQIFDIRQGGLSIHGMIIVGVLTVFYLAKKHKITFFKLADILACSLPLAQSIGRWGNFFNSEAFGLPTNGEWGLFIPLANRPFDFELFEYYHPTFLYESVLDLFVFFVLLFILKKTKRSGVVFFSYLILYAIVRIMVEYIRMDSALNIWGLPVAQIISIIMIQAGTAGLYLLSRKNN